jgi:hypothetical protein
VRTETVRIRELVIEMEDDLTRLKDGAKAVMAIASAHKRSDIGWIGERLLEHAEANYARWRDLFKATSPRSGTEDDPT